MAPYCNQKGLGMSWGVAAATTSTNMVVHGWHRQDIKEPCNKWFITWIESPMCHRHLNMAWVWASTCVVKHFDASKRVGHALGAWCGLDSHAIRARDQNSMGQLANMDQTLPWPNPLREGVVWLSLQRMVTWHPLAKDILKEVSWHLLGKGPLSVVTLAQHEGNMR